MSRRSRLLLALTIALLLIGSAVAWGPALLAPRITAAVEQYAADHLAGTLTLGSISLTALSTFPDLTLTVDGVTFTGEGPFADEPLLEADTLTATLDLWAALSGTYRISALTLTEAAATLHVAEDGAASWDITQPTDSAADDSPLILDISALSLEDVAVAWLDIPGNSTGLVEGLTGTGSLSLGERGMVLTLDADAEAATYTLDETSYLSSSRLSLNATLLSDADGAVYTFADNRITINDLPLTLDGTVGLAEEGLDLDLRYAAAEAELKALLSAIPALYARSFADMDASGAFTFAGTIAGRSATDLLPALTLDVTVADGRFGYASLPGELRDLAVDLSLASPAGPALDDLSVDVRTLTGVMLEQPFSAHLTVTDTQADPLIDAAVKLSLDLSRLGELIPLSAEESYTGRLTADVAIAGRASDASAGRYADFSASGPVTLDGVRYRSDSYPHPIDIERAEMALTPAGLRIDALSLTTGSSDAAITGQLDDLLGYMFEDAPLQGTLAVRSRRLDLADFSEERASESEPGAVTVPDGYAMTLDVKADTLVYDDMSFSDVTGEIDVREQAASMRQLSMRGLGGALKIDGSYTARSHSVPLLDLTVSMDQLDAAELAQRLDVSTRIAPLLAHARGALSADLTLSGQLDDTMSPVLSSIDSSGRLQARTLTLSGAPALTAIADALNSPTFKELSVGGVKMSYAFDAGRVKVEPTALTLGGYPATLSGSQGLDQTLDYLLTLELPTAGASGVLKGLLDGLGGIALPEVVPVSLVVTGTVKEPKVKASLAVSREELLAGAVGAVVGVALSRGADATISEAAQAVLDAAREKADAVLAAAQAASDAVLAEAERQGDALVDAASGALAKSLAEKAADALRQQARKKSRQLLAKAEVEAERILESAAEKAAAL